MNRITGDYFPLWIRLTHFSNFLFITLLIRSGIEIIGAHPKFYWNDDCLPGSEWLRLAKERTPETGLWTAEDEVTGLQNGGVGLFSRREFIITFRFQPLGSLSFREPSDGV